LTASRVNGSRNGARSGAHVLTLLSSPLTCQILKALSKGPRQQSDLRRAAGSPAQTTLRAQLRKLGEIGAIEKRRRNHFPGVVELELSEAGRELLSVTGVIEGWLALAPGEPLQPGGSAAKAAIKALVEGWSTTMLRALAAKPLTLTELDGVIASLNYPSLERRLSAMRLAGMIVALPGNSRGTPYGVTDWARQAVGPLAAAAQWERRYLPETTAPIGKVDTEAVFLLAVPLLRLPEEVSGSCRMAAEISNGKGRSLAGVLVEGQEGRISSCTTRLEGHPDAWASGSTAAWLGAVIESDHGRLEMGGDCALARGLVEGLHESLFAGMRTRRTY